MSDTRMVQRMAATDFLALHAQINADPVIELNRRLQMWASVPDTDGGALSPSAAIVPDETITAVLTEISRLTARVAELEKALKDAQQTMRNAWGAVTTNQIADKGVAEMLKDGVRRARTTLEASEKK